MLVLKIKQLIRHNCHPQVAQSLCRSQTSKEILDLVGVRPESDMKLQKLRRHRTLPISCFTLAPSGVFLGRHTLTPMRLPSLDTPEEGAPFGNHLQNQFISCPRKWAFLLNNYITHKHTPFLGVTSQNPGQQMSEKISCWIPNLPSGPCSFLRLHGSPHIDLFPQVLTWQAFHFMNMTLSWESPLSSPRTMLSPLLRSLKRSWD